MAIGSLELYATFGPLLGIAEHRANTFQQLTKLSGRLDLLVNQIKQNIDHDIIEDSDLLVYEDKNSDDDGMPHDEESSDDQWEDDAEEEQEDGMDVSENGNDSEADSAEMESDDDDDDDEDESD